MIIDTKTLDKYELPVWYAKDKLLETIDKKYSIYAYNAVEYLMDAYACNVAVYKNGSSDQPILNSAEISVDFDSDEFYNYYQ
jgi:hypothetical protein